MDTGLCQRFLPELPALSLEIDEHHRHKDVYEHTLTVLEQAIDLETAHEPPSGPDFVLRFAALMHDDGQNRARGGSNPAVASRSTTTRSSARKMTAKRMQALRSTARTIDEVSTLVALHLRFHGTEAGVDRRGGAPLRPATPGETS